MPGVSCMYIFVLRGLTGELVSCSLMMSEGFERELMEGYGRVLYASAIPLPDL